MDYKVGHMRKIEVRADWDPEAQVWVACSDDIPGLITEAATVEALRQKLSIIIPELLEANGITNEDHLTEMPLSLVAHSQQVISLRD
jgi:predicted RNase H-like HicB family nuclease